MLAAAIAVFAAAVVAVIAFQYSRRKGCATDVPAGSSFLGALLRCGVCPAATACHRHIEEERAKHGKVRRFCPNSPFMVRLTGRDGR